MLNNKDVLVQVISDFEAEMTKIKESLLTDNKRELEEAFIEATRRRVDLEKNDLMI